MHGDKTQDDDKEDRLSLESKGGPPEDYGGMGTDNYVRSA